MVNVIAKMEIKPGCMEQFLEVLFNNIPNVRAENGCIRYEPCSSAAPGEENVVILLETWQSEEHLKAHLATPHMAKFREDAKELRFSSQVTVVTPIQQK